MRVLAGILGWTTDLSCKGIVTAIQRIVREDGFGGVSFFYHYPLDELTAAELARLRALAGELGIVYAVHGPFHDHNIGSHYEQIRRASVAGICAALDFAAAIGAQTVTFHPKVAGYGRDSAAATVLLDRARSQEAQSLREVAAHARRVGTVACYENMDPTAMNYTENVDPAAVMTLLAPYLGPSLGLTYDPAHAHVGKHDPVAAVHTFGPAIRHVHLSDNDGSADQHRPLGRGTIDVPAVLSALHDIGYNGALELELGQRDEYLVSWDYLQKRDVF